MGATSCRHSQCTGCIAQFAAGLLALFLLGWCPESRAQDSSQDIEPTPGSEPSRSPAETSTSLGTLRDHPATTIRSPIRDIRLETDDWTFRPTVVVRRGTSQGSGTIVASLERETLIVTAGHVVRGNGPIVVELHRYNLGVENVPATRGKWPRQFIAEQVAVDSSADVAIIRLVDLVALPYVARMGSVEPDNLPHGELTSVGIDLGTKLSSWNTRLVDTIWLSLNDSGIDRPFLVTARIPEHGRSGGGLFDKNGRLIGVCTGHAELVKGRRMGIFSSVENLRELMQRNDLKSVVDRSEARRARTAVNTPAPTRRASRRSRPAVTSTDVSDSAHAQP